MLALRVSKDLRWKSTVDVFPKRERMKDRYGLWMASTTTVDRKPWIEAYRTEKLVRAGKKCALLRRASDLHTLIVIFEYH